MAFVKNLEELETANCQNCILVVGGELVATPLQPKEYPFYYPDEHRYLIELFERKQPAAIIAATGKHALCGLQPFPLFEDGNFMIPSAYVPEAMFEELQGNNIDIVPFNGEEYYEASGEVEYLKYISSSQEKVSLVINIDSPCHAGSKIAVSLYNFDDPEKEVVDRLMQTQNEVVYGPEWYAGDHAAFAFRGIPCMVLTSSDLFEGGLDNTHTMRDTLDTVDLSQVELAANYINQYIIHDK